MFLVAQVIGDLAFEGGLEEPLRQLLQQPALAGQFDPVGLRPVHQLTDQLVVQAIRLQPRRLNFLHGLSRHGHVCRQVSLHFQDPPLTGPCLAFGGDGES